MQPISYHYDSLQTTTLILSSPIHNNKIKVNLKKDEEKQQQQQHIDSFENLELFEKETLVNHNRIYKLKKLISYIRILPFQLKKILRENFLLCIWMFINLLSLLMNQSLEENYNFNSYNSLIGSQLLISFIISYTYQKYKNQNQIKEIIDIISISSNDKNSNGTNEKNCSKLEIIKIIIPLSFIFVINCIFNSKISENIVEFSKTVVPLFVIALQFVLTKKRYAKTLYYSILVLVIGTGIFLLYDPNSSNEDSFSSQILSISNYKNLMLSITIISFMSLTLIYSHSIFSTKLSTMNPILIIHYFTPISLVMLLPFILSEKESLSLFIQTFQNEYTLNDTYNFLICLIISGVLAYFTFYITFIANKKYNILVMSISRNSKSILLKLFSSGVFNEPISNGNWCGFVISTAGIIISYLSEFDEHNDNNNNDTGILKNQENHYGQNK